MALILPLLCLFYYSSHDVDVNTGSNLICIDHFNANLYMIQTGDCSTTIGVYSNVALAGWGQRP